MLQQITPRITSVGVDNPNADLFEEQFVLNHGMSYNSYAILADKIAVMDSVEAGHGEIWMENVLEATSGRQPDYLVVHHMEPDHSACILEAMKRWPGMTLVGSQQAIGMLTAFFPGSDFSDRTKAVREGDTLDLGGAVLRFYAAPMVHWPEVMVSVEQESRVLFSADAFGKFGSLQYADEWINEARRYYFNIVGKYGHQVSRLLAKLSKAEISTIAPLHGPVLTGDLRPYLNLYTAWSSYLPEARGVMIAYASIYGGTEKAALRLAEMLRMADAGEVTVMNLCRCDQSEALAQAFRLSSLVVAAPTYDAGLYPAMYDFLHHLAIKNFCHRRAAIIENGSWAPAAGKVMASMLEQMSDIEILEPRVTIKSRLNADSLAQLSSLAEALMR